jgi:hypothetical protein
MMIHVLVLLGCFVLCNGFQTWWPPSVVIRSKILHPVRSRLSSSAISEESMNQSTPKRVAIGSIPEFIVDNDSIVVTPVQKGLVAAHFALITANMLLATSTIAFKRPTTMVWVIFSIMSSIVAGDFGTGVFHWAVDNYGSLQTPVFGEICAAFQGHHQTPWTITFRPFPNNVYKIAIATIPVLLLVLIIPMAPTMRLFFALFVNWWLISQELHKLAHMKKISNLFRWLQDHQLILSRKEHGLHHNSPFTGHYCILTGICNPLLDKTHFFRHLEKVVFRLTGNRPITWQQDGEIEEIAMASKLIR